VTPKVSNRLIFSGLLLAALVSFAMLAFPMYVIRPFRSQGTTELAASLIIGRWSAAATSICAGLCLLLTTVLWLRMQPRRVWMKRIGTALIALLVVATSLLARVNIFERMFHPITTAQFVSAASANTDNKEMVLAVNVGPEQRAYPVAIMAYHHVLNDVLGGEPLVVTY
jgi:hypothetical protein